MCGRFIISSPKEKVKTTFALENAEALHNTYNGAPTQALGVITQNAPKNVQAFRWGLVPSWATDTSRAAGMINVRVETLDEKSAFREALLHRRCLVPADGFYEWKNTANVKIPYRIYLEGECLFAFAGLWDVWRAPNGEPYYSFTVITTAANKILAPLHARTAVMFDAPEDWARWLDPETPPQTLQTLLRPLPDEKIRLHPVGPAVNHARNDGPELIRPYDVQTTGSLF